MLNFVRVADATESIEEVERAPHGDRLDTAGAFASFLCAIHCAIVPFVITILPLIGLGFLASRPVEWGLIAASATIGTFSLCLGFREHGSRRVFAFLGIALTLLVAGRIFEEHQFGIWGPILMVAGGFTMAGTHVLNRALCRACRACHSH
jgi:hypothetical protein